MAQRTLPHIDLPVGGVSPEVIVCGDPARAARVAEHLIGARLLAERREYRTYQGEYEGTAVTVTSHGVGAPGAAIAFEELIAAGAQRIVRVGSCGGLQPKIQAGDLVVATAAVQQTGYGHQMMPAGYPAVADCGLTQVLLDAAGEDGRSPHTGIILTADAFYDGGPQIAGSSYARMAAANVLAVEMECAALFLLGSLRRVKTAAILAVDGNVLATGEDMATYEPRQEVVQTAVDAAIEIALQGLQRAGAGR